MPPSNEAVKFLIASLDGSQPSSGTLTVTNVNVGTGPQAWRCIIVLPEKKRCYGPARENIRDAVEHQLIKFSLRISDEEKQRLRAVASAMQLRRCGTELGAATTTSEEEVKSSEKYETPGDIPMQTAKKQKAKKRKLPSSIPVEHLTAPSQADLTQDLDCGGCHP